MHALPQVVKSAKSRADIPNHVLESLNQGLIETRSLVEGLAIDFCQLIRPFLLHNLSQEDLEPLCQSFGITKRMRTAALLLNRYQVDFNVLAKHPSDTVRGWAAYQIALHPDLKLTERFQEIKPLADDPHFGVREWAWLAMRPSCLADLEKVFKVVQGWTSAESENLRRFSCELTRPRGVWCAHIPTLKDNPQQGLKILEPLKCDPSRYVQNSVANWLNDAAKSKSSWVIELCQQWLQHNSKDPAVLYICRRAQRSLNNPFSKTIKRSV